MWPPRACVCVGIPHSVVLDIPATLVRPRNPCVLLGLPLAALERHLAAVLMRADRLEVAERLGGVCGWAQGGDGVAGGRYLRRLGVRGGACGGRHRRKVQDGEAGVGWARRQQTG